MQSQQHESSYYTIQVGECHVSEVEIRNGATKIQLCHYEDIAMNRAHERRFNQLDDARRIAKLLNGRVSKVVIKQTWETTIEEVDM